MTAERNKVKNVLFFFCFVLFLEEQKKCVISVCAKQQHREAEPPALRPRLSSLRAVSSSVGLCFCRKGREIKLKAYLSASAVPGYRNM